MNKYLQYIKNTGGSPSIDNFDEDWEPIGSFIRADLLDQGLVKIVSGHLMLTDKGQDALAESLK